MAVTREEITATARKLADVLGYTGAMVGQVVLEMERAGKALEEFSRQLREMVEGGGVEDGGVMVNQPCPRCGGHTLYSAAKIRYECQSCGFWWDRDDPTITIEGLAVEQDEKGG